MALELAYSTTFPGTALSSWDGGNWFRVGTATSESFNNPGFSGVFGTSDGYFISTTSINVNPARDFTVEISIPSATTYFMGPAATDGTGNGAYSANWNSPVAALILALSGYGYPGGLYSSDGSGFATYPCVLRMNKTSSGFNVTFSLDGGSSWSVGSGYINPTFGEISQVGFLMGAGGVGDQTFAFDSFKVWRDLPAAVPGQVTGVSATPTSTTASVSWTPVTEADYYQYRINGGSVITSPNSYVPNATVTGLTPSTSYTVEVRGVNSNGSGSWSSVTNFTTVATTYYFDDFNRANNTSSLGSPVTGGPYTVQAGTWGINTNQCYTSASVAASHVTVDLGVTNFEYAATFPVTSASCGIIFYWTDASNFYLWHRTTTDIQFYRRNAGTFQLIWSQPITSVANDKMTVVTRDGEIYCYLNDKRRFSTSSQIAITSTVGLYISSSTAARIDNAAATSYTNLIGGVDGGGGASPIAISDVSSGAAHTGYSAFVYKGRDTKTADSVAGVA
jgi:hypothetical protein